MMRPAVTVDANLLASGSLRARPDAAPVQLLDVWLAGRFTLILSDHLLLTLKTYQGLMVVSVHEFLATLPGLSAAGSDES